MPIRLSGKKFQLPVKMEKNIVEVKNIVKKYGNFTAVDNISFHIKEGDFFSLLGP